MQQVCHRKTKSYINMIHRLNPLLAFIGATAISTGWMFAIVLLGDGAYAKSANNIWEHIGFVWVPVIFAICIQSYSSISLKMSLSRGFLLSVTSAILAPMIAASILMFIGFVWLGWHM